MEVIMILGHHTLDFGLRVKVMLIILMSVATITENELSRWLKNDAQL